MSTPRELAMKYAPEVRLHPDERYFPMDPLEFVEGSTLHRIPAGQPSNKGRKTYNPQTDAWEKGDKRGPPYQGPPLEEVNRWGLTASGNRRPWDADAGNEDLFWLTYADRRPVGNPDPTGSVSTFYDIRETGAFTRVTYWFYYGYSDFFIGPLHPLGAGDHQGDWEHVTIELQDGGLVGVTMAQHNGTEFYGPGTLELIGQGNRAVVYSGHGSHGSYPRGRGGGYGWKTWKTLRALATQPWRDFSGAWGVRRYGSDGSGTGPLGPWYKRHRDPLPDL